MDQPALPLWSEFFGLILTVILQRKSQRVENPEGGKVEIEAREASVREMGWVDR